MRLRSIFGGAGAVFFIALANCGGGSSGQGGLRQGCYPNGSCNVGLTCVSQVCVDLAGAGGTAGGGTAGIAGTGAAGATGTGAAGTAGTGTAGAGGVGNIGGAAAGAGGVGNTGGAAAGAGGVGNTGGAAAGTGGQGCPAPTSYTETSLTSTQGATTGGLTPYEEEALGVIAPATLPDLLDIQLFSAETEFPGDIMTGTFQLTADDAQNEVCGICILIYTKATTDPSTGFIVPQATYLATQGTLTLTSLANKTTGTGTIAGSISNVRLQQVTIDSGTGISTAVGSCTTSIPSLSFSVTSTDSQ